ncbi:MAG: response regulator [SAR324 cluster bacterium]|nr:response regulator [SAR324 cluster bacterium]
MLMEPQLRVLVVDDDYAIRRFLNTALQANNYMVFEADCGEAALQEVINHRPDIIFLDLGLPRMDGIEVTRRLREWTRIPIIILSVREQETDKIAALDAGADDYLTKPFSMGELMARVRAALRRAAHPETEAIFQSDNLVVDLTRRLVTVEGREIQLTPTEYDVLRLLVTHAGKVMTHQQILQQVWQRHDASESHLLRVNISNLRRKIETDSTRPRHILTEPGVGYRLKVY